jgi:hypothetical protein
MWLFFEGDGNVTSTDAADAPVGSTSAYNADAPLEQLTSLKQAYENFVASITNAKTVVQNVNKSMTEMEGSALALQRSMGGVVMGAEQFRQKLISSYHANLDIGVSFKDTLESVEGIAAGMGRMVNPSEEVITNMLVLSKSTGMAAKDIGGMVTDLVRFGGTQLEATKKIETLSKSARAAGLNAASFVKNIQSDLKKVSGFGFKSGVDGLSKMVKQAMLLRTTVQAIGAQEVQNTALDPEGAIQLAADFQMLGGAVGKLADPFQLMYMAQNDVEGLQKELVNSTKAAMSFNKETGNFDVSTEDMYRLRQQAKLTGANLEDLVNTGREAAKLDYLKEKFDLGGLDEDTQNLVAGLAEIGEGGKVSIDIPGFKKLEADTADGLKAQLQSADAQKALKDYQDKAAMTEKDLAIAQQTISEKQAIDVNIIKEAVLKSMSQDQQKELLASIKKSNEDVGKAMTTVANSSATVTGQLVTDANTATSTGAKAFADGVKVSDDLLKNAFKNISLEDSDVVDNGSDDNLDPDNDTGLEDGFIDKGTPKFIKSGKNKLLPSIDDQILVAPNITDYISKSQKLNEMTGSLTDMMGGGKIGGAIDININVGGAVTGDRNADVSKIFNDPKVQKQIMDTVLYKLDAYKRQQGVLK